jgi:methyl-accepting chemotaxis protein
MRLTIGARLGLGFLIMLLLVAAAGSASIITVRRLADLTAILAQESDEVLRLRDIGGTVVKADTALERAMEFGTTEAMIVTARFWQSELQDEVTNYLDSTGTGSSEAETLQKLKTAQQNFDHTLERYTTLTGEMDITYLDIRVGLMNPYLEILTVLESAARGRMVRALEEIQRAQSLLLLMMIGFTVIAALLGAGLAVGITRSVTRPVRRLVKVADNISMGDLDMSVEVTSQDEIGELQESIERMRVSLKTVLERLKKQR